MTAAAGQAGTNSGTKKVRPRQMPPQCAAVIGVGQVLQWVRSYSVDVVHAYYVFHLLRMNQHASSMFLTCTNSDNDL